MLRTRLEDGEQQRVEVALEQLGSHRQHSCRLLEILSVSTQHYQCSVTILCVTTYRVDDLLMSAVVRGRDVLVGVTSAPDADQRRGVRASSSIRCRMGVRCRRGWGRDGRKVEASRVVQVVPGFVAFALRTDLVDFNRLPAIDSRPVWRIGPEPAIGHPHPLLTATLLEDCYAVW